MVEYSCMQEGGESESSEWSCPVQCALCAAAMLTAQSAHLLSDLMLTKTTKMSKDKEDNKETKGSM